MRSVRRHMKRKVHKVSIFAIIAMVGYVASYVAICVVKPEFLNTHDGPVAAFRHFYHPLRYVSADRPAWHSKVRDGWLEIQIDWINPGNGYLYFLWGGREHRAAWVADLHDFKEGDFVLAHFRYELVTSDDFSSRVVPCIDMLKPPNQSAGANVGERRSRSARIRTPLAALPAMAPLPR
jgi:hypothetical protein